MFQDFSMVSCTSEKSIFLHSTWEEQLNYSVYQNGGFHSFYFLRRAVFQKFGWNILSSKDFEKWQKVVLQYIRDFLLGEYIKMKLTLSVWCLWWKEERFYYGTTESHIVDEWCGVICALRKEKYEKWISALEAFEKYDMSFTLLHNEFWS